MSQSESGISLQLSEDQLMLKDSAHEFAKDVIRPAAAHHDETGEYAWDVIAEAHDAGLMNLHIPSEYEGMGFGHVDGILIAEELAWGCSGIGTALEANGLAQAPVLVSENDYLIKKYLVPQIHEKKDGRPIMCAYAVTEPGAGSDVAEDFARGAAAALTAGAPPSCQNSRYIYRATRRSEDRG